MSRSALVGNVTAMLEDAGFVVSERCAIRPKSFDVAARRGDHPVGDFVLRAAVGAGQAHDASRPVGASRRAPQVIRRPPLTIGSCPEAGADCKASGAEAQQAPARGASA